MKDPTKPELTLLVKLGSLAVHVQEARAPGGHEYDWVAVDSLLKDPEVETWMTAMDKLAFLPKKRR